MDHFNDYWNNEIDFDHFAVEKYTLKFYTYWFINSCDYICLKPNSIVEIKIWLFVI